MPALFAPVARISNLKNAVVPSVLFNFAEENVPVTIENTGDEVITLYENTTLGTSEFFRKQAMNHIVSAPPQRKTNEVDDSYDLKYVIDSINPAIPIKMRHTFAELVQEFSVVFSKSQLNIGKCDATSHKIDVYPGSKPVKLPNRRLLLHYKQDLREKIDAFLDEKLVMPCHSPYSAPAMPVLIKNGKLRLVLDYRQLNRKTITSCWPIPSIEEISDTLEGSAFFSTIDMSWGFYQLQIDEKCQDFTAFSIPFGSYKLLRLPMGLTGSPDFFQSLMEHFLVGLTWKTTVPYLDDCIIFAATPEEHLASLRGVLQRFREANLKINPLKSEFFKTKVHFLGHILSANGLQLDPEKNRVKKFPIPTTQTELKSFLGRCLYYRRYVENFAEFARPLHKLTESSPSFTWTPEAQTAFETLQAAS